LGKEQGVTKVRPVQEKRGWAWATVVGLLHGPLEVATKRDWVGGEKIPATGGCVVAVNHISHLDPITFGHFLYDHGRMVQYLAKDALFTAPVLGAIVRNARQIPVSRLTTNAALAFESAVEAVNEGGLVGVYPEGTITRDPDGWPMRGKTGAARIALITGCPVIPIGQWGAQEILPAYTVRPHLFPRKTVHYKVGDPVDLRDLVGKPLTTEVLHEATDRIMADITALVEDLRGEKAPAARFDPRTAGNREIGNPKKDKKGRR
jgi:1-acyl-sn-glycerol-3-phosphate acyltransferase